jgi:hypothetical protein
MLHIPSRIFTIPLCPVVIPILNSPRCADDGNSNDHCMPPRSPMAMVSPPFEIMMHFQSLHEFSPIPFVSFLLEFLFCHFQQAWRQERATIAISMVMMASLMHPSSSKCLPFHSNDCGRCRRQGRESGDGGGDKGERIVGAILREIVSRGCVISAVTTLRLDRAAAAKFLEVYGDVLP